MSASATLRQRWEAVGPYAAMGAAVLAFLLLAAPDASWVLFDPDQGNQLAKATQIALGKHPFADFTNAVYGPLVFYSSYAAQVLSGWRVGGEMALQCLGYTAAYLLLFRMLRILLERWWAAGIVTALLVVMLPRFYKYYIVLGPALFAVALHAFCLRPSRLRLAALGAAVTVTGLYRLDFGGYAAVTAVLAVALTEPSRSARTRLARVVKLAGVVVLLASPWLVFLATRGNPLAMAADSLRAAIGVAGGLSKPSPDFEWAAGLRDPDNRSAMAFGLFRVLPFAVGAWIVVQWRRAGAPRELCVFVLCLCLFAALVFLQATHRAGPLHLLQVIPVQFVLLAWIAASAVGPRGRGALAVGLALVPFWLLWPTTQQKLPRDVLGVAGGLPRKLGGYTLTPAQLREPERWVGGGVPGQSQVAHFAHEATPPGTAVLFLPYEPQLYYVSQRGFDTPFGWLNPGRFRGVDEQEAFVRRMATTRLIADQPDSAFDQDPERNARVYAPVLMRHVYSHYGIVRRFGSYYVLSDDPELLLEKTFFQRRYLPCRRRRPGGEWDPFAAACARSTP